MDRRCCVTGGLILWLACGGSLLAAEGGSANPAAPPPGSTAIPGPTESPPVVPGSIRGQEQEDLVEPLKPAHPRTAADQARIDALSWFATGRILQGRGDLQGAFRAFQRAVEQDPGVLAIYRQLIPLALHLNQAESAMRWVQKASELAPDDFEWLVQLAELQIRSEDLGGAIDSLERATRLPSMDPKSTPYIVLKNQLGQWYLAIQRFGDAARVLEPVFEAVLDPQAYKLTAQVRNQILANLSFEKFGEVFLEGEKPALALSALNKAIEKRGGTTGDLSFQLARAYLMQDNGEQSLAELQKYIDGQRQSKRQGAYDLLGDILKKLGRPNELLERLEQAAQKDPKNPYLQLALADQYSAADRLDQAEAIYKKTLAISADARGYAGLAKVYRRQNRPAELLAALGSSFGESGSLKLVDREFQAILSDPALLTAVLQAGRDLLQKDPGKLKFPTGYVLAHLATDGKQTDLAVEFYKFLLKVRSERRPALYEELGTHLMEVRRYTQAADMYQEAIDSSGAGNDRAQYMYARAYALALSGKADEALEVMQTLISMNDRNPGYRFREAWILAHARRFEQAIPAYEKLLEQYPNVPQLVRLVRSGLSNIYVSQGDVLRGEQILEEVFRENPDDVSINNDLGYLYADQGKNLEQAEKMIRKAVEAEPDNGAYLDSLGWVLFRLGRAEEALPLIQKSIEKGQGLGDETLFDHLGDVLDRLGRTREALEAWGKGVEMAKKNAYPDPALIERMEQKFRARSQSNGKIPPIDKNAP